MNHEVLTKDKTGTRISVVDEVYESDGDPVYDAVTHIPA